MVDPAAKLARTAEIYPEDSLACAMVNLLRNIRMGSILTD